MWHNHCMDTIKCITCGKSFKVKPYRSDSAQFCSRKCYMANRWADNRTGKCRTCGKSTKTTYCSDQCLQDYWNKTDYHERKKPKYWKQKIELIKALGGQCATCGTKDIRVLDLHHIDPSKKVKATKNHWTWLSRFKDWKANNDNLEILCANCHRVHTFEQMGYANGIDI